MNLIFCRNGSLAAAEWPAEPGFRTKFLHPKSDYGKEKKRPNHYRALMISESFFKGSAIL
jgi:hypothetical protein